MDKNKLMEIVSHFQTEGTFADVAPLTAGLINDSYKVFTLEKGKPDYVLQHINNSIFQDVDMLMDNIMAVTRHLRKKLEAAHTADIDRHVLTFIPLRDNPDLYYYGNDETGYWRLMIFIEDSVTKTEVTPETSYEVGIAFGKFQADLADIPQQLGETIPNFHNMEFRLQQLQDAIKANQAGRLDKVRPLIDAILEDAEDMCRGERLHREGKLPKRICHCDTKVNNILFDKDDNILCVIDLDTVMPNFVFSDIGDFLRWAANTSAEDEPDLDKVNFNFAIFEPFIKGYLQSAGHFLLPIEIENIPYATLLFPYMQAVRFLCDYLNGDTYYKTQYPEHNLVRTKTQFKLYQSVKDHQLQMAAFIKELLAHQ
ncbi:MAG: aminoglycoside phosphotransferase family protein [Bacteroidaceae bacterium]|nr:aminoglycoside phosphotransferase family protein [Bacteroidaceae bacterium]